ncbi:hypothetical protein LCGC14_1655070 [marine sediment metagenome]|uniref:Uncharacterized protein n=1 Tax=marine sediment metagenome TaxID=412755 RepID=A0A0F9II94_9ZZZZ
MDYEEAQDYRPTHDEIDREIRKHGADPADFWHEVRAKQEIGLLRQITGQDVLDWLGY